MAAELLRCELRRRGWGVQERFQAWVDPDDGAELRRVLRDAIKRERHRADDADYSLTVRPRGSREFTVVPT